MADDGELPRFRPKMGRRPPAPAEGLSLRRYLLARVLYSPRGRGDRQRASIAVRPPRSDWRRVAVQTHFVRMAAYGASRSAAHLRYIQREGVAPDGSSGVLYGPDGPVRSESFEEPRAGEKRQFRIMISPEDGRDLDLTDYVRRVMARVERDVGLELEWAAANHYNTDHPHAHVLVRGVDRQGREVRFDRAYVAHGMRARAQEIATQELGPRSEVEVRRSRAREVAQERFTSLDRELERLAQGGRLRARDVDQKTSFEPRVLRARLEQLEAMQLAARAARGEWELRAGWQNALRELALRNDIVKQMHQAVAGDPQRYHVVARGQAVPGARGEVADKPMVGRVAAKGLADELKGTFYAVVETPNGAAYHLALDDRTAERLRTGDLVAFVAKREPAVRPVDRQLADLARHRGGVVTGQQLADAASDDRTRAAAAERRLGQLEKLGLVEALPAGSWRVPNDLLAKLEQHHARAPATHRLFVDAHPLTLEEQARYRGPVWLDELDAQSLAPRGFGADVRRALDTRAVVLRELGLAPDDPRRRERLSELERRTVAADLARRGGEAFLETSPDGFRGRATELRAPSGRVYMVVSDHSRFVLIADAARLRHLAGQEVLLRRTREGRIVAQPGPERGGPDRG